VIQPETDLIGLAVRIFQGATSGFGGESRRVYGEAGLQIVWRLVKNLGKRLQGHMPGIDAVVAAEDFFEDGFGSRFELRKLRPVLQCAPGIALGIALLRSCGAKTDDKHGGV
jgi:hypothetical protein